MTNERYCKLQREGGKLTAEEIEEGWHWCPEMDGLLCIKDSEDCFCDYRVTEYPLDSEIDLSAN
jgi:hypothetical protein